MLDDVLCASQLALQLRVALLHQLSLALEVLGTSLVLSVHLNTTTVTSTLTGTGTFYYLS